jgi:hypothetical protein
MSTVLAAVLVTIPTQKQALPAGLTAGPLSVVVTDSNGVAQAPVSLTGTETPPFSFNTSLPVSSDGVTVSAAIAATALYPNGTPIPGATRTDTVSLTEPAFNAPSGVPTMTLTPAAAAANPAIAAAVKK